MCLKGALKYLIYLNVNININVNVRGLYFIHTICLNILNIFYKLY